jgi:hypothetical protein
MYDAKLSFSFSISRLPWFLSRDKSSSPRHQQYFSGGVMLGKISWLLNVIVDLWQETIKYGEYFHTSEQVLRVIVVRFQKL